MQKKLVVLTALLSFSTTVLIAEPSSIGDRTAQICGESPVVEKTKQVGNFKAKIGRSRDSLCHFVEIKEHDHLLYRDREIGSYFYFGANVEKNEGPFQRLQRGGHLNLILSKWTGGAHCCFSLQIFDLENGPKKIADVEGGSSAPVLKDLDGDGFPEIEVMDDFLAYRFSSFATTAIGRVVLKYKNDQFVVAPEFMRKPAAPLMRELSKKIGLWKTIFKKADGTEIPQSFMQAITDLTFTGNRETALDLIKSVWPTDRPGRDAFIKDYKEALLESRFYSDFEKGLN